MIELDLKSIPFALVVGLGNGACEAISQKSHNENFGNLDLLAIGTDQQTLANSGFPQAKQLLLENVGSKGKHNLEAETAVEIRNELKEHLANEYKIVFILSELDGNIVTSVAPIIAEIYKESGILVVSIVSTPHKLQEELKLQKVQNEIDSLVKCSDAVFLFANKRISNLADSVNSQKSVNASKSLFFMPVDFVLNSIFLPGYIRFDFEDIESILRGKQGLTAFISGLGTGDNRSNEAIKAMYASPYLSELKANDINEILLFFESGNDEISMNEIGEIVDSLQDKFGFETQIIWGSVINLELKDHIRINAMVSGEFEYSKSEFAIGG